MHLKKYVIAIAPIIVFVAVSWTQQSGVVTSEEILKKHNIEIARDSLVAALRNDDADVRRLAAEVLVNHWKDAATEIEEAMQREAHGPTRISMAFGLARLGDPVGREVLLDECHDTSEVGSKRVGAAWDMSELHDDGCVDAVLEIVQSSSDPRDTGAKMQALVLVPTFIGHLNKKDSDRVYELVANALEDPWAGVRVQASNVLVQLEYVAAIPQLREAIAREEDESSRAELNRNLKQLQKRQREKAKQSHQ